MARPASGGGTRVASRAPRNRDATPRPPRRAATLRNAPAAPRPAVLVNTAWDSPAVPPAVLAALRDAPRAAGIDPALLLAIAWRESRFDPEAVNRRSSARGLLQVTEGTWLQAVRAFGPQHGLAHLADGVETSARDGLVVADPALRRRILALRRDPRIAVALTVDNLARQRGMIEAKLGRAARATDFYLAHVLGPVGTERFLDALLRRPRSSTREVLGPAVLRNAGLLTEDGRALSVAAAYAQVAAMLDRHRALAATLLPSFPAPRAVEASLDASPPAQATDAALFLTAGIAYAP